MNNLREQNQARAKRGLFWRSKIKILHKKFCDDRFTKLIEALYNYIRLQWLKRSNDNVWSGSKLHMIFWAVVAQASKVLIHNYIVYNELFQTCYNSHFDPHNTYTCFNANNPIIAFHSMHVLKLQTFDSFDKLKYWWNKQNLKWISHLFLYRLKCQIWKNLV